MSNDTTFVDRAIARIRAYLADGNLRTPLAKRAGLKESTIRDIEAPHWNPTAATLRALEQAIRRKGPAE